MSCSLELFFAVSQPEDLGCNLERALGARVEKVPDNRLAWEFQLSSILFWISETNEETLVSDLATSGPYFSLEAQVPREADLDWFCLVYAVVIKTLHIDLVIDSTRLEFSCQSRLATFQTCDDSLLDQDSGELMSFVELPLWLRRKVGESLSRLGAK